MCVPLYMQVSVHLTWVCLGLCVSLNELMWMWGDRAMLLCPLPVLFCGLPPFPSSNNQLMVGLGGSGPAQGGHHLQRGLFVQLRS